MIKVNPNYLKLKGSYLFSDIARKVAAFNAEHPDVSLVRLGIGDVTRPLGSSVIRALHLAVDDMADEKNFRGYAPDLGYDFLRSAICGHEYKARGCDIHEDEIFVSDGAKSDSGNIQEIFSEQCSIAVTDPVYPVYIDSNVMAGRTGTFLDEEGQWSDVIYMPCTEENSFSPVFPKKIPDLIYICSPNNPTGTAMTLENLQAWVDYANKHHSVILFDAAYEAYISEDNIPHSIYECRDARNCAIEIRSFSKNAGFTGVRLGYTVVPKDLKDENGVSIRDMWARRHSTKFNGAPYIQQRAGEAVFSEQGQREVKEMVSYYMKNAGLIRDILSKCGYTVYGGVNAPYIWLKAPNNMTSWEFFDFLLNRTHVVGTPGSGFGPSGEGFLRLTAFGSHEATIEALDRISKVAV